MEVYHDQLFGEFLWLSSVPRKGAPLGCNEMYDQNDVGVSGNARVNGEKNNKQTGVRPKQ